MAQGQAFTFFERVRTVLALSEALEPERVGSEQTVGAHMPRRGMPETAWVIQNRHAHGLAINRPVVIHPLRAFTPGRPVRYAVAIDQAAAFIAIHIHAGGHTHAEARILFIAQNTIAMLGYKTDRHVNDPLPVLHAEHMRTFIGQQLLPPPT